MFVLNTNQSPHSVADKLWLTVIPFIFNPRNINGTTFDNHVIYTIWDKKFQWLFTPKFQPISTEKTNVDFIIMPQRYTESKYRFLINIPLKWKLKGLILPITWNSMGESYLDWAKIRFFKINSQWEITYTTAKDITKFFTPDGVSDVHILSVIEDENLEISWDNEYFGFELSTFTKVSATSASIYIKWASYNNSNSTYEYYPCLIIE